MTQETSGINRSDFLRGAASVGLAIGLAGSTSAAPAQDAPPVSGGSATPKAATAATREVNAL